MSRAKTLFFFGMSAVLVVIGVGGCWNKDGRYVARPTIRPSTDSVPTIVSDPVPTHGYIRARRAIGCGRNCTVDVWIGAYASAKNADMNNPPATPLKVARVISLGSYETEMYGIEPHRQYDMLFQRGENGAEIVFEPITRTRRAKEKAKVDYCRGHPRLSWSEADFRGCNPRPPRAPTRAIMSAGPLNLLAGAVTWIRQFDSANRPPAEDPAWFSCTSGCCTAMSIN